MDGVRAKYDPDGSFVKDKARVFANGSGERDEHVFESSSPVARTDSVFTLATIGAYRKALIFTIDVVSAYPRTPRPPHVKYKYLRLQKDVAKLLCEIDGKFVQFLSRDGTMVVELRSMLYGQKEAGYEFYILLFNMLYEGGFRANPKDPCVIHRVRPDGQYAHAACTVDDSMWIVSSEKEEQSVIQMYRDKFGADGFTVRRGEATDTPGVTTLMHIGVQFVFDYRGEYGEVLMSQRHWAEKTLHEAGFVDGFDTRVRMSRPCAEETEERDTSPKLLEGQQGLYRSLTMSLMYGGTRTYPELLPPATGLARHMGKATEYDMKRLLNSVAYLALNPNHCLRVRPTSMVPIGSGDAAYASFMDAKSQTGLCIGFKGAKGHPDAFLIFQSQVQPFVAKSSTEAEIIASNTCAERLMWWSALLEGFGVHRTRAVLQRPEGKSDYAGETVEVPPCNPDGSARVLEPLELLQDNLSAIYISSHAYAGFAGTKHMRVRYYYIRELVMRGEVELRWQASEDMVSDMLSKCVSLAVFQRLLPRLIGEQP
jgi:hypothetical protein